MTPVGWTILILLLLAVSSGLELVADALRLRAGAKTVPSEFSEQYPAEVYAKAGLYSRERARVSMVEQAVTVVAFLIFWFAGGFPWLDGLAARGSE
ncbi:MAG TPA: hypothetical protein VK116_10935, partial [Planctomycetota bacterium]|nr:hypothetical protein [Planctomycetota bacterium]